MNAEQISLDRWFLNDDCVLDGGSNWFRGAGQSGMKDLTSPNDLMDSRGLSALLHWNRSVFHSRILPNTPKPIRTSV